MGTKYDEIISEIKGDLSEEEIYHEQTPVCTKIFYFYKNLGYLPKIISCNL